IEGAFCVSGGEGGVDEPTRVRQIRPERIWTTAGRPRSAKREGVNPRDGVHNPRPRQVTRRFIEGAFCVSGGEDGVDEPTRVRQIRPERIWTAEWLALEHIAWKGESHGWNEQCRRSLRPRHCRCQAFYVSGGDWCLFCNGAGAAHAAPASVRTVQISELVGTRHADHVAVIPELAVHGAGTEPEMVDHVHPGILDELMLVAKVERQMLACLVSEAHPQQSARAVWNARIAADDVG